MPGIVWLIIGAIVGIALGFVITRYVINASTKKAAQEADDMIADAKRQAETMRKEAVLEAKDQALKLKQEAEAENKERMKEVRAAENRVSQREESIAALSRSTQGSIKFPRCKARLNAASAMSLKSSKKPRSALSASRA